MDLPPQGSLGDKSKNIAARLRELGVYSSPSYDIAERMVEEDITDPDEAERLYYEVLAETSEGATSDSQAVGRAVARLKAGDWDTEASRRAVQRARQQRYQTPNEHETKAREPSEPKLEGEQIWQRTLEELRLQMAQSTFDQNLACTEFLEQNDGVFRIGTPDQWIAEVLENRLGSVIERTLNRVAERPASVEFVVK